MRIGPYLKALGELLFPPRCQVCHRFCQSPLCRSCVELFERIVPPWCEGCGKPFDPRARARPYCAECADRSGPLRQARSFGVHASLLRDAVNLYKFGGLHRLGLPLGRLLAPLLEPGPPLLGLPAAEMLDAIVPVPLHPARRAWRGFDQAELLSQGLSGSTGLPVRAGLLARGRDTRPQVGLSPRERAANVRGAFCLGSGKAKGLRVLLVDDVYTTGATLRECARVLREGGAEAVVAATVSRAAPEWHPEADLVSDV